MKFLKQIPAVSPQTSAPLSADAQKRELFRVKPLDAAEVAVRLVIPGRESTMASLSDLALSGAGVAVPFEHDPCLEIGAMVEVHLEHTADDWRVDTPARVAHTRQLDDLHVVYGLEFVNTGNLYAQMDDAWAHYFNRRAEPHFGIDLDAPMHARLRQNQHRMDAGVTDISRTGLCLRVPHHMAASFVVGQSAQLLFDAWSLPGEYELAVDLVNRRTLGEWDYLGLTIQEHQPTRGAAAREILLEYVETRHRELEAREADLRESAA